MKFVKVEVLLLSAAVAVLSGILVFFPELILEIEKLHSLEKSNAVNAWSVKHFIEVKI